MRRAAKAVTLAVLASAATARAQAPGTAAPPDAEAPETRSPSTALWLSLGGTAAGFGVMLVGERARNEGLAQVGFAAFALGPTFGHWYAGRVLTPGLGFRVGGLGLVIVGAAQILGCVDTCSEHSGPALLALGTVAFVGGGLYDIGTAPGAADDFNRRHARVAILPTALPSIGGPAPALALVGSF